MAVATKAAAFCVFVRFFEVALGPAVDNWQPALAVLAAVSIVVGNIGALGQDSLKRLLGYSGVAQAGYMLVGLVAASELGVNALVFYLAAYALMNLAAFAVIVVRERETEFGDDIKAVQGLGRDRPELAWPLTISMLALAGPAGDGGVHGQALPDRGGRGRRLHLARGGDRDRDDDLARLLPAGGRRRLDAARGRSRWAPSRAGMPAMAGGSPEADSPDAPPRAAPAAPPGTRCLGDPGPRRGARRGDDLLRRHPLAARRLGLERRGALAPFIS